MKIQKSQLAKNIERFRRERDMSKTDLSRESNVSRPSISLYESGQRRPKMDAVCRIAAALRVSPAQLDPYGVYENGAADSLTAAESGRKHSTGDVFDQLAKWLKREASAEGKAAILSTAEALGFKSKSAS